MVDVNLSSCTDSTACIQPLRVVAPYLIVVEQQLPVYRDESGQLYAGDLWHKDLTMHLEYIDHLMLASPCHYHEPPSDAKPLLPCGSRLEIVELPSQRSFLQSLRVMPVVVYRLCKAIRRAEIVHSGIVGWPVPMGWLVTPLALAFRKRLVIIVESAPWRLPHDLATGWKKRVRAVVQEFLGRTVVRNADLVICTQDEYRQSLLGPKQAQGFVIPASWIDEKDILSQNDANGIWMKKLSKESRLNILFVGRLAPEKGLLILLKAIRELARESLPISLGILGDGPLRKECESTATSLQGATAVKVLGTVQYGAPLFSAIRQYDAVVVPSITDEQPRIVFDAFSQAVPVLASDTPGLRSCVPDGTGGFLVPPNDVSALCGLLRFAVAHRSKLRELGLQSLSCAHKWTHQEMHRERAKLLHNMIYKESRGKAG